MFDKDLARRFLNKIGKEIVTAQSNSDPKVVDDALNKALSEIIFMYDILHINDDIEVINIKG